MLLVYLMIIILPWTFWCTFFFFFKHKYSEVLNHTQMLLIVYLLLTIWQVSLFGSRMAASFPSPAMWKPSSVASTSSRVLFPQPISFCAQVTHFALYLHIWYRTSCMNQASYNLLLLCIMYNEGKQVLCKYSSLFHTAWHKIHILLYTVWMMHSVNVVAKINLCYLCMWCEVF